MLTCHAPSPRVHSRKSTYSRSTRCSHIATASRRDAAAWRRGTASHCHRPDFSRACVSRPLPPTRVPSETRCASSVWLISLLTPWTAGPHRFTGSYHVVPVTCACVLHFESCTYEQWRNKFLKHRNTDEKKKAEMCEPLPTPAAPTCSPPHPYLSPSILRVLVARHRFQMVTAGHRRIAARSRSIATASRSSKPIAMVGRTRSAGRSSTANGRVRGGASPSEPTDLSSTLASAYSQPSNSPARCSRQL